MVCETSKIDSNITGLRFAEEECIGELPQTAVAIAASGYIQSFANPEDGATVTVGATTYTFVDVLTDPDVANEVLVGLSPYATLENLVAAIMAGAGDGVVYGTGTTANADATAEIDPNVADSRLNLDAINTGVQGNAIALSSTAEGDLILSGSTLSGGVDAGGETGVWEPLEPNSYTDFGAEVTTVARTPINPDRQRKKGIVTDVDASGGFNQDLTFTGAQQLLQGFMFADFREKTQYLVTGAAGDIAVVVTGDFVTLTSTTLNFLTLGLVPGEWIFIGGDLAANQFNEEENNGFKRIRAVAANALTIDKSEATMVAEVGTGKSISLYLGRTIKNEAERALIKRRTYQIERTLGSTDGLEPPQSEYLIGAVPSEMVVTLATADKITADYSFVAIDNEQRTQTQGLKPGDRPQLEETDAYNSSSDVARIRLALAGGVDEAPQPLFGYSTDFSVTVNNTLTANKAIGRATAFDVSAGTFAVSASVTAYFSDIEAVKAVRNNEDVTIDVIMVKAGKGIVIDMPLVALGDGRLDVELDQPIMLPLSAEAATGAKVDPALNHTLLFTFFDQLPQLASTAA